MFRAAASEAEFNRRQSFPVRFYHAGQAASQCAITVWGAAGEMPHWLVAISLAAGGQMIPARSFELHDMSVCVANNEAAAFGGAADGCHLMAHAGGIRHECC